MFLVDELHSSFTAEKKYVPAIRRLRSYSVEHSLRTSAAVLELGTFTGVSALVFYEATKDADVEVVSMDMSETYLQYAQDAFRRHGADHRIKTVKGPCLEM